MPLPVDEFHRLTQDDFTEMSDIAAKDYWVEVWKKQVATTEEIVFLPGQSCSFYLEDAEGTPAECTALTLLQIQVRDAAEVGRYQLLPQTWYSEVKEFQEIQKLKHYAISKPLIASAGSQIVIMVRTEGVVESLDASDCYFELCCRRVRKGLFE